MSQPQPRYHVCEATIPIWRWELWKGVLQFMKINKKALSTGKSSLLRVIVVLIQVRSGLYGITILQFFRSAG